VLEAKRLLGYSATPMMHGARSNILDAVGDTPLVRLRRVVPPDLRAEIYVKCEFLNPGGSLKDRAARSMIDALERDGRLKPGGTLVEATSGSTGAALAMVAAVRGYRTVFVVPEKTSQEKIATLRAWGAKVVVCPAVDPNDPRGFLATARRLADETPNAVFVDQFHNPANPLGHYVSTGPELWAQTQGELDVLVAGVGTGGALAGTGKFLKEKKPEVTLVGVDPWGRCTSTSSSGAW
jgi:cystathionine beta-synthase